MWPLTRKGLFDSGRVLFLPVDSIHPNPDQPRQVFAQAALEELAGSIRELGVLQPLTVRRREGRWELVADGQASSLLALVENLQRRDLDFWEEALALRRLIDSYHISQEEAARRIGKSQSAVANKLRLLKLPPDVLTLLREGGATERHARALLRLETEELQREGARQAVKQSLTVAQTEALVDSLLASAAPLPRKKPTFIIKDVRLFLNTITHSLDVMRSAGVDAQCCRQDSDEEITLTIHIPRRAG